MIQLDNRSSKPLYEQIIEQVKYNVIKGYLQPGDAIPSVRKLALELSVTPATVAKAYQELERQKVIETIRAKGTFIAACVELRQDEDKIAKIRQQMNSNILELKLMGYDKQKIQAMVEDVYDALD